MSQELQAFRHHGEDNAEVERIETGTGYTLHMYDGILKWVPADWQFPHCGVFDLWRQWWIGDHI